MRFFLLLLCACVALARADVMDLHDGDGAGIATDRQYAVGSVWYNRAAFIAWRNKGGDWVDKNGLAQGPTPFASAAGSWSVGQDVNVDVTGVVNADGITIRRIAGGWVIFGSRESATPPRLNVTYANGVQAEFLPLADSSISLGTVLSQGKLATLDPSQSVVMRFPPLGAGVVSAVLRLRVTSAGSGSKTLGVFAMVAPRSAPGEYGAGYSQQYPGDVGIESDARTLYAEGWDDPANWWRKNGGGNNTPTSQWLVDGIFKRPQTWKGMWLANGAEDVAAQCSSVMVPRGTGFIGNGVMGVHCQTTLAVGVNVPDVDLKNLTGGELSEVWLRYYIRYAANHRDFTSCEGGKAPGIAGNTDIGGSSGVPSYGLRGWSLRHQFQFICDPGNPAYPYIHFAVYAYRGDITDVISGEDWSAAEHSLLETDRWYCIEQHVKVNTPGVNDGLAESFIDGRLMARRDGILLRSVKPAEGYGMWMMDTAATPAPAGAPLYTDHRNIRYWLRGPTIDSDGGIEKLWGMVHNGGRTPTGKVAQFWYDQTVVARERVGCMVNP